MIVVHTRRSIHRAGNNVYSHNIEYVAQLVKKSFNSRLYLRTRRSLRYLIAKIYNERLEPETEI